MKFSVGAHSDFCEGREAEVYGEQIQLIAWLVRLGAPAELVDGLHVQSSGAGELSFDVNGEDVTSKIAEFVVSKGFPWDGETSAELLWMARIRCDWEESSNPLDWNIPMIPPKNGKA